MPRRQSFTAAFKLKVIQVAEAEGNRAAARKYDIAESNVRRWRADKENLNEAPKQQKARRGKSAKWPEMEEELLNWVKEKRQEGCAISTTSLRLKAKTIAKAAGNEEFKASQGWAYRFMGRHGLSVRRRTHLSQRLPDDIEAKTRSFQRFVIKKRKAYDYPLASIGNADQTPLTFDLPRQTTVAVKGSKTINVSSTGHEKDRFTVMLSCTADGRKLPPYVVFKRKTMPKEKLPNGVIVRVHPKGWMNEELVDDWLRCVWGRRVAGLTRRRSLLVLDAFRCHKTEGVKETMRKMNTDLAIIPGGMTSLLQPLDVSMNKPFKDGFRRRWTDWMMSGEYTFTKGGRQRKADLPTICSWILGAWEEISPDIVRRSFLKCCISNQMDGTEDDIIWEDELQEEEAATQEDPDSEDEDLLYPDSDTDLRAIFEADSEDEDFLGF